MSRINAENPQESQGAHVPNHHSIFPMGNNIYMTSRFAEYVPFFFFNGYEKDNVKQRSITTTRSLSLKAPLMEDITLKRDYLQVYFDALLPINWDKCYVRPKQGDIVDWSKCSTNVSNFRGKICGMASNIFDTYFLGITNTASDLYSALFWLTFLEMFFSDGALINHFGCHLSPCFRVKYNPSPDAVTSRFVTTNFDKWFDAFCAQLMRFVIPEGSPSSAEGDFPLYFVPKGQTGSVRVNTASDLRFLLQLMREDGVSSLSIGTAAEVPQELMDMLGDAVPAFIIPEADFSFDLAPLWAYQIACAHFYTDDNVDYVFSAELFRSYISSFAYNFFGGIGSIFFSYNGSQYQYDWLSAYFFDNFVNPAFAELLISSNMHAYFRALFGFNRSLRYQDYFAGARTRPIAVGDEVNVTVNDGKVSVIDVTASIQWQRLLNNIQRLPQEIGRFISAATGKQQSFDYHNPGWLAHTKDTVFAAEVENTGAAQISQPNSVTATLRGKSSDQEFTFSVDRPCIIIGVQYFDIRRAYYTGVKRVLMNEVREDMFMPELQYIGDQPISNVELLSSAANTPFGYTEQYSWLKQNYDEALGGFVNDSLPGWAFLFKPEYWHPNLNEPFNISPSFIRSVSTELDEFFLSLTGYSLGTYFHFQQKVVNITSASRNMVKHSQILQ